MLRPNHTLYLAPLLFSLAACGGASSQLVTREMHTPLDRSTPPAPGTPRPFALPGVQQYELPNGMNVVLVNRGIYPTFSARLLIRAGHDVAGQQPELAELVARAVRDGARDLDAMAISQFIDGNAIAYGASVGSNAVTLSADALADNVTEVLDLLSMLAAEPTLSDERLTARRDDYAGELRLAAAQEGFHRDRISRRILFGEHPYGAFATPESVATLTPEVARAFYEENWAPNRSTLLIVGALPEDIETRVSAAFSQWSSEATPWQPTPPAPIQTCNVAHVVERPNSAQTAIAWLGPGVGVNDPTYFNALLANQVLGGGASARLFLNLREDKSFTYGAYSSLSSRADVATFSAASSVRSDVTAPALAAFVDEFTRLDGTPIPDDEFQGAQDYLAGSFPNRVERNAGLAGELTWALTLGLPLNWFESYQQNIRGVDAAVAGASTPQLVSRDQLTLVMVGEAEVVRAAAPAFASTVYVYGLDGALIDTLAGELESTCGP